MRSTIVKSEKNDEQQNHPQVPRQANPQGVPHAGFPYPPGLALPEGLEYLHRYQSANSSPSPQGLIPPQAFVPPQELMPQQGVMPQGRMPQQRLARQQELMPPQGLAPPQGLTLPQGSMSPQGFIPPERFSLQHGFSPLQGYFPMLNMMSALHYLKHYLRLFDCVPGASETYTSRWFAYDVLKFLDNRNKPRKRMNTVVVQQPTTQENTQNEFTALPQRNEYIPTRAKQAKKDDNSSVLSDAVGILQTTANMPSDLMTTFASYVAAKIKTYAPQTRNSVEHAIFEILKKADKGYYESSYRQQDNHQTSYQESYSATPKTRQDYVELAGYVNRPGTFAFRHPTFAPPPDTNQQESFGYSTARNEEYDMDQHSLESQQSLDNFDDLM